MKTRLQAQATQETTPKNSLELSDDDIEVAYFLLFNAHTNVR